MSKTISDYKNLIKFLDFVTKKSKIIAHTAVLLYYNLKAKVKEEKVMTLSEIYTSRKTNLIERLSRAKSLYETGSVISEMFETIQYQYLSRGDKADVADKLDRLVALEKANFPMLESVNKSKLWENSEDVKNVKKKSPLPGLIALLVGVLMVLLTVYYYMFLHNIKFDDMQSYILVMATGCFVILLSGFMLFHTKKIKSKTVVEISADAGDLADKLEAIFKEIDDILRAEQQSAEKQKQALSMAVNPQEVQLLSYLMEAKYSGQGDFALEQLDEVELYLAKMDILVIKYSKGNEKYFEFLEGDEEKTIRPALIRGGEILAMGLAQVKPHSFDEDK